jgi:hypothetical protein
MRPSATGTARAFDGSTFRVPPAVADEIPNGAFSDVRRVFDDNHLCERDRYKRPFLDLQVVECRGSEKHPSPTLEELDRFFVVLRSVPGLEAAEVPPLPRLGIFLPRIEPILAGLELSDHGCPPAGRSPGDDPLITFVAND